MKYINGDLFDHVPSDQHDTLIAHICNSIGAWGAGFVVPLGRKYPAAMVAYRGLDNWQLGTTQFVVITDERLTIANMIAQEGIGPSFQNGKMVPPIRYEALRECMKSVAAFVELSPSTQIACPMFGAGLAGGDWSIIEQMIREEWSQIETTVYYLPMFLPPGWEPPA
jgi:O-acetyl-ADP-ribose deacetylase (regulator of RNase III)